ncbi:single-stranded DNA-binding protein [Sphingobacterium hungaricum]|uniref:Single-stranded DNA-binding protein n=1 Tax=Sphingobacterium hungaricum TaxID=2082723 RepID=A0A928YS65_9SPHI|nr:single-stranded DNA-binding protein [Sphingobacterium hungaricum]MBE8713953.1 single-stranded DNA-binding protein [Sphingobacterium hungaricum]
MSGVNKVILVGFLGKDPEIRYLDNNISVANFPLATTETVTRDGKRIEQTEWHNIVLWRGLAEAAFKHLSKGKQVYLEGKLRTRSYEDKEGIRRYLTEIVVDVFNLLGRRSDIETKAKEDKDVVSEENKNIPVDFKENNNDSDPLPF